MRLPVLLLVLLISLAGLASAIHAQTFPSKPLRIIVPFPPGGAADITSRLLGERMAKGLGQPVIAENRPGAGAVIGYELAARAPGAGTTHHVVGEMFRLAANINIVHAPFQGEAPALTAAAGGHIPMVFVNASAVAPFAKSGKIRALAVTTPERTEVLPDVPTMREAGYPEIESTNWSGLVVPTG